MKTKPILKVFTGLIPLIQSRSLTNNNQRALTNMSEKFGDAIERLPGYNSNSLITRRDLELDPVEEQLPERKLNGSKNNNKEPHFIHDPKDVPNDLNELVEAIKNNDAISFTRLIDEVDDLNVILPNGKAPIHYAVEKNNESFVAMLCAAGADCDLRSKTNEEIVGRPGKIEINPSPIEMAIDLRLDGMFNLLLKEVGVRPKLVNDDTLLHRVASEGGTKDMVKSLVQEGLPIDSLEDYMYKTPLHVAAENNNLEVVKELLILGAKTNIEDSNGNTPLHYATLLSPHLRTQGVSNLEMVKELLIYGAKVDIKNHNEQTPLHYIASDPELSMIIKDVLKNDVDVDVQDHKGGTPLHYAAANNREEATKELLKYGAKVDIKDDLDRTPLFGAVMEGSLEATKELLKYGAKVDIKDYKGKTPLYYAKSEDIKSILCNGQSVQAQECKAYKGQEQSKGGKTKGVNYGLPILFVASVTAAIALLGKVRKRQNQRNVAQSEQEETIEFEMANMKNSSNEKPDNAIDLEALGKVPERVTINEQENQSKKGLLQANSLGLHKYSDQKVNFRPI